MSPIESFTAQLDREVAISRRVLGSVPGGRDDWKPRERSMALGHLLPSVYGPSADEKVF